MNSQYLIVLQDVAIKNVMRIVYMDQDYQMIYWFVQKCHHALLEKINHVPVIVAHTFKEVLMIVLKIIQKILIQLTPVLSTI